MGRIVIFLFLSKNAKTHKMSYCTRKKRSLLKNILFFIVFQLGCVVAVKIVLLYMDGRHQVISIWLEVLHRFLDTYLYW